MKNKEKAYDIDKVWKRFFRKRSGELRNTLVKHYMYLVKFLAGCIWAKLPGNVDLDDLISVGTFGLMETIESFDPSRNVKFTTYCVGRIKGSMLDELRATDWVPRLTRLRVTKVRRVRDVLIAELGREPSEKELYKELGLNKKYGKLFVGDSTPVDMISLDENYDTHNEGGREFSEVLTISNDRAVDPLVGSQRKDFIKLLLMGLNRTERLIIVLYYYEEMTQREIGQVLELSESRVSQLHKNIVKRLHAKISKEKFLTCAPL